LIEIINKQLLLQLVGYLCYWQMGFNSVFKGLNLKSTFGFPIFFSVYADYAKVCCHFMTESRYS